MIPCLKKKNLSLYDEDGKLLAQASPPEPETAAAQ